jgi:hypothetical protein
VLHCNRIRVLRYSHWAGGRGCSFDRPAASETNLCDITRWEISLYASWPLSGADVVHFETAFSAVRAWSIWSYAYGTIAPVVIASTLAGE